MKVIGFIPVRYESSRLYGKALKKISGIPAIVHVYKRSILSKELDDLYVVTDSIKIKNVLDLYSAKVILTSKHNNGTERIYEVTKKIMVNSHNDEKIKFKLNSNFKNIVQLKLKMKLSKANITNISNC